MTVRSLYDEDADAYELGDDIDGVFIAFATLDGPAVRGRVESVQSAQTAPASGSGNAANESSTTTVTGPTAGTTGGDGTATAPAELTDAERQARRAELQAELDALDVPATGGGEPPATA